MNLPHALGSHLLKKSATERVCYTNGRCHVGWSACQCLDFPLSSQKLLRAQQQLLVHDASACLTAFLCTTVAAARSAFASVAKPSSSQPVPAHLGVSCQLDRPTSVPCLQIYLPPSCLSTPQHHPVSPATWLKDVICRQGYFALALAATVQQRAVAQTALRNPCC